MVRKLMLSVTAAVASIAIAGCEVYGPAPVVGVGVAPASVVVGPPLFYGPFYGGYGYHGYYGYRGYYGHGFGPYFHHGFHR